MGVDQCAMRCLCRRALLFLFFQRVTYKFGFIGGVYRRVEY